MSVMKKNKNIFIFNRHDAKQYPGGDTVQIQETSEFLKRNGYSVTIGYNDEDDLSSYDLVIIFNLQLPYSAYLQAKCAVKYNKPYIFFPIYWDMDSLKMDDVLTVKGCFKQYAPSSMKSLIRSLLYKTNRNTRLSYQHMVEFIINHATVVCPNSNAELEHLVDKFPSLNIKRKAKVVYNGINIDKINYSSTSLTNTNILNFDKPYLCCIGAIGPRKNQMNLVKAMNGLDIQLLIVGKTSKENRKYCEKVKKLAPSNVTFVDYCNQDEVFKLILNSRGIIQPSFIETPGLVALEALALGKNVIVSNVSPVHEYFANKAIYIEPNNYQSITYGIKQLLLQNEMNHSEYFKVNYDWNNVLLPLLLEIENIINQ